MKEKKILSGLGKKWRAGSETAKLFFFRAESLEPPLEGSVNAGRVVKARDLFRSEPDREDVCESWWVSSEQETSLFYLEERIDDAGGW